MGSRSWLLEQAKPMQLATELESLAWQQRPVFSRLASRQQVLQRLVWLLVSLQQVWRRQRVSRRQLWQQV
jgi:hypothetical protein